MNFTPVESSAISEIGYDPATKTLRTDVNDAVPVSVG